MADDTRTDPNRGYSDSPDAYDFHRSQHSRRAEQEKINQLAAARAAQAQPPTAHDPALVERVAALERRAAEPPKRSEVPSASITLTTWLNSVVTYVDVKSWS